MTPADTLRHALADPLVQLAIALALAFAGSVAPLLRRRASKRAEHLDVLIGQVRQLQSPQLVGLAVYAGVYVVLSTTSLIGAALLEIIIATRGVAANDGALLFVAAATFPAGGAVAVIGWRLVEDFQVYVDAIVNPQATIIRLEGQRRILRRD